MINEISHKITTLCIEKNVIVKDKQDIYDYGMGLVLSTMISLITIIGISIVFNKFFQAIVYLVFFIALRNASGGYHSKTYFSCFIKFFLLIGSSLLLSDIILRQTGDSHTVIITAALCLISIILVILYAPVDTENKRMSDKEKVLYREKSMKMVLLQGILLGAISYISPIEGLAGGFGMLMQGITLLPVINK